MTPDQGQRFMFDGHPVRGQMACIETTLAEVFGRHSYPARVAEQLGEALVAVALLGDTLKFEGSLILQIKGDGPLNTLMVERDDAGRLRGIARHDEDHPALTAGAGLKSLYGSAYLAISILPKDGSAIRASYRWMGTRSRRSLMATLTNLSSCPHGCG